MADESNPEGVGEDGLTDEQRELKARARAGEVLGANPPKQRPLRDTLKAAAEAAKAAAQVEDARLTLPKGFDGTKPPKAGVKIKLSVETWQTIHGDNPNAIWLTRGRDFVPNDRVTFELPTCRHCGACARRHGKLGVSCLGCGIPVGEGEE